MKSTSLGRRPLCGGVLKLGLSKLLGRIGNGILLLSELGTGVSVAVDASIFLSRLLGVVGGALASKSLLLELLDLLLCLGDVLSYVSSYPS